MNKDTILPLIRHILTAVGAYFIGKGAVDESTVSEIVGALTTLISIGWMISIKAKAAKEPAK